MTLRAVPPASSNIVLAVGDDPLVLACLVDMLEDIGYLVHQAANGTAALEVVTSGAWIDLVITDVRMPHMDGIELTRAIKRVQSDLPVLIVTGFTSDTTALAALLDKTTRLLAKPYTQDQLILKIDCALKGSPTRRPLRS